MPRSGSRVRVSFSAPNHCGSSSVGRARPCQGRGREFESRFPLKINGTPSFSTGRFCFKCLKISNLQNGGSPPAFSFFPKSVQESVQGGLKEAILNSKITRFFSRKTPNRINFFAWEVCKIRPMAAKVFKAFYKILNTYVCNVLNYSVLCGVCRKYPIFFSNPP